MRRDTPPRPQPVRPPLRSSGPHPGSAPHVEADGEPGRKKRAQGLRRLVARPRSGSSTRSSHGVTASAGTHMGCPRTCHLYILV